MELPCGALRISLLGHNSEMEEWGLEHGISRELLDG